MNKIEEKMDAFLKKLNDSEDIYDDLTFYGRNKEDLLKTDMDYCFLDDEQIKSYEFKRIGQFELNQGIDFSLTKIFFEILKIFDEKFLEACNTDEQIQNLLKEYEETVEFKDDFWDKEIQEFLQFVQTNRRARDILKVCALTMLKTGYRKIYEISITNRKPLLQTFSGKMNGFLISSVYGKKPREFKKGPKIKLYMTMKEDSIVNVMSDIGAFLLKNDIKSFYKTRPNECNDMLTIRIDQEDKLDDLVGWLKKQDSIYYSNHPFMPVFDGVGITLDDGGSYNRFISNILHDYMQVYKDNLGVDSFKKYLQSERYNNLLDSDEKRMFNTNLSYAFRENLTIKNFLELYESSREEYEHKKMMDRLFSEFETKFKRNEMIYNDNVLIEFINSSLQELKVAAGYEDVEPETLLFSYYNKEIENNNLIDYLYSVLDYRSPILSYNPRVKYYFNKMFEKWNEEGGMPKISNGLKAFKSLSKHYRKDKMVLDSEKEFMKDYFELSKVLKLEIENICAGAMQDIINSVINELSDQFDVELNKKDSKAYALRKIYKKKATEKLDKK